MNNQLSGFNTRLKKLPVIVFSGFLGVGKTTLINHILNNWEGPRVAIIVNDMSEVNIDVSLVREGGAELSRTDEELMEMRNGCICCTLREDPLIEVGRFAREGKFDQLVIESTSISEPLPIGKTFTFEGEDGSSLGEGAQLDIMFTVVDAFNHLRDYSSRDGLHSRGESMGEQDDRTVVDLLFDQIQFCDMSVLNKVELISDEERERLMAILRSLNPRAKVEIAEFSKALLDRVLDTGLSDLDDASKAPDWLQKLRGTHTPETEEYAWHSQPRVPHTLPFPSEALLRPGLGLRPAPPWPDMGLPATGGRLSGVSAERKTQSLPL